LSGTAALGLIAGNLALLLLAMTALWGGSLRLRNASIVDIFWGPACAFGAVLTLARADGSSPRDALLTALVCLWAGRLALHLARRNIGHGEDFRYRKMREKRGSDRDFARWSLVWVFWLQGVVAWFVSLPTQIGQLGPDRPIGVMALAGAAIFAVGLAFETIGDLQLARFKANPANKGKLMTTGLWAFTRHPNYFGDSAVWVGLTLIALEAPHGWLTALSPIVMAHFLINISGKALLERTLAAKYPEYADYRARVSGFFPLPPRSSV
jgi:steroid 5-alpha reductase family enzyme